MRLPEAGAYEGLLLALLCAVIGSMFAAAESALGSLNPSRLGALLASASGRRKTALERYVAHRAEAHARWLVGRVLFTALAALLVALGVAPHVPAWSLAPLGALGALLTYGVIAEAATAFARNRADFFASHILGFIRPLEIFVWPLSAPLSLIGTAVGRALGPSGQHDPRVTETEVEWVVSEGQKQGALAEEPAEMIRNVLELKDLVSRDVLVSRTRVSAVDVDMPLSEVLSLVANECHSRYPVYRGSIDNIVGLLYVKDLFRVVERGALPRTILSELVRTPVIFVPEMQGVSSILREMRARRQHLAVVIDEFGGVSGIVTLEDILEVIVGEIRDEYDTEEAPIQDLGHGKLLADAAVSVHDLSAYLAAEIPDSPEYESLGGLLVHRAGHVPAIGARIDAYGLSFIVRDADEKRIAKVEIVRLPTSEMPPASDASPESGDAGSPASSKPVPNGG